MNDPGSKKKNQRKNKNTIKKNSQGVSGDRHDSGASSRLTMLICIEHLAKYQILLQACVTHFKAELE